MNQVESTIIEKELERMRETYGITDLGLTGTESFRVTLAIIADREDSVRTCLNDHLKESHRSTIDVMFDHGGTTRNLTINPGWGIMVDKDMDAPDGATLRAWHDYQIDDSFDLGSFEKQAMTPEIEAGFGQIAIELRALFARAERLIETPGPVRRTSKRLWGFLTPEERQGEVMA